MRKDHKPQFNLVITGMILLLILLLLAALCLTGRPAWLGFPQPAIRSLLPAELQEEYPTVPAPEATAAEVDVDLETSREIELIFVGDILIHLPILNQGIQADGVADFSWLFKYTKDILQEADLSIGNLEGTLTEAPFAGYPIFRAPTSLAENLQEAGFDYLSTVNNHALDGGMDGVNSTVRALRAVGLDAIGTRISAQDPSFLLLDVEGISLALSSFSYETAMIGQNRTLNGAILPLDAEDLLDTFSVEPGLTSRHQEDEQRLRQRVQEMRKADPDVLIFLMHWGTEYAEQIDSWQEHYASILADEGVDLVIGGHPHVVQPLVTLAANNESGRMICYYSLGNFISNQQPDTGLSGGRAEEGAMARVVLQKQGEQVRIKAADYIPLYMYKEYPGYPVENKTYGWVLPVERALADPPAYQAEALVPRLEQALNSSRRVLGEPIIAGGDK